jgi:hypothetical protein
LPLAWRVHDLRMSEHTDATEDRPDDDDAAELDAEEADAEEPQPWAKTSSGDDD